MQDLYAENYQRLGEIKEYLKKWRRTMFMD